MVKDNLKLRDPHNNNNNPIKSYKSYIEIDNFIWARKSIKKSYGLVKEVLPFLGHAMFQSHK